MEHSYARAGGGGVGGAVSGAGTSLLLVRRAPRCPDCHIQRPFDENLIDIETIDNEPTPPLLMDELPYWEKALVDCDMIGEEEDLKPDWEEKLHSQAWSSSQSILLDEALTIIHTTRAALLTAGYAGARRAAARGGGARSLRALLGAPQTRWQPCLAQWLHNALMENLPTPLLACYREIMLTMKSKVPVLVEKMTMGHPLTGRIQGAENGASGPTIASGNNAPSDSTAPLLLLVPSGRDKRDARWAERLRAVAQVHIVHSHQTSWPPNLPISSCLSQLTASARTRAEALKVDNPHRPIVLVGQGAGAAIAIQLAVSITGIAGIICLGLPLLTADGPRGTPEDCLLDLSAPILLVIGQNSSNSSQQDAEILRSKLRVKSKLVVAGGADELLRLSRLKRQLEGVTQRMLECAIADEVGSFLSFLMHRDDAGTGCSSPESYGGLDGDRELMSTSPTLVVPKPELSISNKRRHSHSSHKKKKLKYKAIKTISPVKSRGSRLFDLNNPPPEGTTASIGDILNFKVKTEDEAVAESKGSISPPPRRAEHGSFIQITNNRLTRSIPITGNGSYDTISKGSGIRVLENIPFKSSNLTGTLIKSGVSGVSGPATTPLALPPRRMQGTADDQQTFPITSTNILELPIVFADDNKSIDDSKIYNNSGSSSIKTIIINKQQVIPSLEKNMPGSSHQSRNVVQVKMPSISQVGSSTTQHQPVNVKQSSMSNSVKYAKVILAKRASELPKTAADGLDPSKGQIINKPIIVKGKGNSLAAFKVLPGNIFQKNTPNVFGPKQRLIIKRAVVPSGLNVNSPTSQETRKSIEAPRVDGKSLRENSTDEKAIEAAVASISSPPNTEDNTDYMKSMLENFD